MPFNYNNQLYSEGPAGLIDFVWLWYNRISIVIAISILAVSIILVIFSVLKGNQQPQYISDYPQQADPTVFHVGEGQESFVNGTNFKRLNRSRVNTYLPK